MILSDELIVIALGGNALLQRGQKGTFEEQYGNVKKTVSKIADLIERGYKVVLTHGNGPKLARHFSDMRPRKQSYRRFLLTLVGLRRKDSLDILFSRHSGTS